MKIELTKEKENHENGLEYLKTLWMCCMIIWVFYKCSFYYRRHRNFYEHIGETWYDVMFRCLFYVDIYGKNIFRCVYIVGFERCYILEMSVIL